MGLFLKDMSVLFSVSELVIFIGIALYFISVWLLFKYESKIKLSNTEENAASRDHLKISLKQAVLYYAVLAVIVVGAAIVLPHFANKIAVYTGLGESFTATLFLAAATSLPEVAVSVGAIKLGLPGIAIGNLIGSNLFNMLILFVDDLFYKGSLLKDAAGDHIISVFSILLMTGVVIIGFIYRAHTKKFVLAWETLTILILYVVNMILLYAVR
jgi:cation:H+ antiporter